MKRELMEEVQKYEVRGFDPINDYQQIKEWVEAVGHEFVHYDYLPKIAFIITKNKKKYGCAFMYHDWTTFTCVLEWMYFRPDITPMEKKCTVYKLLVSAELSARNIGAHILFSGSASRGLTKSYSQLGWCEISGGITQLAKIIK